MEDIARGVLAGIAIGCFSAAVVKGNMIAADALVELNALAIGMAVVMGRAAWREIKLRRLSRQIAAQIIGKMERQQADDEAEDEDEDES